MFYVIAEYPKIGYVTCDVDNGVYKYIPAMRGKDSIAFIVHSKHGRVKDSPVIRFNIDSTGLPVCVVSAHI